MCSRVTTERGNDKQENKRIRNTYCTLLKEKEGGKEARSKKQEEDVTTACVATATTEIYSCVLVDESELDTATAACVVGDRNGSNWT